MLDWICIGMPLLCAIVALIIGKDAWATEKKALFPKLVAAGLGCFALGSLHNMAYYFVQGISVKGMYISFLGIIGCFLFLLSASYGQLDRVFDDGSKTFRKCRFLALGAPVAILLLFLPVCLATGLSAGIKGTAFLGWVPIVGASYYNCKHAMLPDCGFAFVKAVRPYNIAALVLEFSQAFYLVMRILNVPTGSAISAVFVGLSLIALMYCAKKGAREWTI